MENKLISSRFFGELVRSEEPGFKKRIDYLNWYEKIRNNFDDFLKQPLEIWQFVPCKLVDGGWVVLEEPHLNYNYASLTKFEKLHLIQKYQEAKYRVLFDGFKYSDIGYWYLDTQENGMIMFDEENIEDCVIEYLVKYNLELTPTALRQLGL